MFKVLRDVKVDYKDYRDRRIILQLYKIQRAVTGRHGLQAKILKCVGQGCVCKAFNVCVEYAMQEFMETSNH